MHIKCSLLLSINTHKLECLNDVFTTIHSAVLELLPMNRHGKANRHIFVTSLCKSVNRTGLPNHNKHDAVNVLKYGSYFMFHNRC